MKLALTGMIASGKTTVLKRLQELGWLTLAADALAWEVAQSPEGVEFLKNEFGGQVPDKAELRAKFLSDGKFKESWASFVHPRVRVFWEVEVGHQPKANWAIEIPLLFEKRLEGAFDVVVVCKSSPALALQRGETRGLPKENYLALSKLLIPLETKESRAHFIITNDGDLPALCAQVDALHKKLLSQ